jgi:outer membrane receptor protein involved in Fe transport
VRRRHVHNLVWVVWFALAASLSAAETPGKGVTLESLLKALQATGVDVIYSSALVTPEMSVPAAPGSTPVERASAALAAFDLELQRLGPTTFVVARSRPSKDPPVAGPQPAPDEPLQEVSVYASRYAIEGREVARANQLDSGDIELVPGSHDDALRSLKSLPGLATNASGRPYIRGSLSEDVLVRYDGITLLDPYHLKNFQSLISAIDPAAVERIEVFSGGFPVRYGTRSGGVIDVTAPSLASGVENRAALSMISAGLSSTGRSERWPLEWVAAIRRSTLDLIDPVEDGFGKPQFSDSLGRLKWHTDHGAWTAGWLLIDDEVALGNPDDEEQATARYRDEYLWLARDHRVDDTLSTRVTAVVTSAEWSRDGTLLVPGVAEGEAEEFTRFDRYELTNTWTWVPSDRSSYSFGSEAALSSARRGYARDVTFAPDVASAFGRATTEDLDFRAAPESVTYALFASKRHRWADFEAELGLRLDGQHYNLGGDHTQISPRLNLRYDRNERTRFYASLGRFTQAQNPEEWRVEEGQQDARSAQVSIHGILGVSFDSSPRTRWSLEAYSKRWTTVSPYFDNLLDPLALAPDLALDRVRVTPKKSEASGLELNVRSTLAEGWSASGTFAWARVADDFAEGDILRSWDQPFAATIGVAREAPRYSVSVLAGWHRGWPRTPFDAAPLMLGARNTRRWADFFSLDLRGSWRWDLPRGELVATLDVTNGTNRRNECCAVLERSETGPGFQTETDPWLPTIVNLGFTYRWRQ